MNKPAGHKRKEFTQNFQSFLSAFWSDWFGDINFIKKIKGVILIIIISVPFISLYSTNPPVGFHIYEIQEKLYSNLIIKKLFFSSPNRSNWIKKGNKLNYASVPYNEKNMYTIGSLGKYFKKLFSHRYQSFPDEKVAMNTLIIYPKYITYLTDRAQSEYIFYHSIYFSNIIDSMVKVDDYIFFSITKIIFKGEEKVVGFGLFSNVFIFGEIENYFRTSLIK